MFPIGSNPEARAERARQEKLADLESHPGLQALREAREDEQRERAEAEAERVAETERGLEEACQGEMEELESSMEEHFVRSGGTHAEFRAAWPSMKSEIIKQRASSREGVMRDEAYSAVRSAF